MTEWVFQFVIAELLMCGALSMVEDMIREREKLPPGCYRLSWSLQEGR